MGDLHGSRSLCRRKRKRRRRRVSWSNLSSELILAISKHLKTKTDVVSFRQVCKRWCKYSVPNPANYFSHVLPCPIPASETTPRLPFHHSTRALSLHVSSLYLITPSQSENNKKIQFKPWMVMAQEPNPGIIRLRHPLTGKRVKDYPPTLNLTRFRTTELAEGYNFKHSNSVHKVVLHSTSSLTSVEALVVYKKGSFGKLTLEKNDDEDCEWLKFKVRKGRRFWFLYLDDVVSFKGMICGVDRKGKLYVLDHEEMTVGPVLVPDKLCRGELLTARRKRLVVDPTSGELHLVVREHVQVKARFKVYRFNEHHHRWDHMVDGIGRDRVLFVGLYHCFFAKVRHFPGCNGIGNCIVFAANCFTQYCGIDYPDRCLFGKEDEDVGVYRLGEEDNFRSISTYPEFSRMLWPPPTWFCIKREYSNKKDETESSSCSEESGMRSSSNTSLPDEHEEEILSESTSKDDSDGEEDDSVEVEEMQSESSQKASKASSSNTSHPDEHEEEILADSCSEEKSGGKEDDNAEDEEMQSESSGQKVSKANISNRMSHSVEDADEEEAQIGSYGDQTHASEVNFSDETGAASSEPVPEEPAEMNCDPTSPVNFEEKNVRTPDTNDPVHEKEIPQEKALANSMPVTSTLIQVHMPVTSPTSKNSISTVKFQGVEIKSHLLPTLETIWAKHGNLVGEDTVRSKDLLACALESLAKMIITLQNTTVRTLTDLQANELRSNLFDLQRMGLKVDWLLPVVDKALAVNRSKPLIESLVAIDKAKEEADEREKKFLAESAKVKQELEENRAYLSTRIPFTEPIDLDECLGQGLC